MTLKDRVVKLRRDNPLFTVAGLVEITLYGDQQDREGDFLSAAAQILHCSQAEVDEAVAFTRELSTGNMLDDPAQANEAKMCLPLSGLKSCEALDLLERATGILGPMRESNAEIAQWCDDADRFARSLSQ